jgi:hypothetical protein
VIPSFRQRYRPLYFLAALGAGGLSVSFFMYLMFLVPHPDAPIPTFTDLARQYATGGMLSTALLTATLLTITYFAVRHVRLLIAALRAHRRFTRGLGHEQLRTTNAEVSLMAIPLTLAMTVNVAFIVAALAIPGLWSVKEYLFPLALLALAAIGVLAVRTFGRYVTRTLAHRGYDLEDANHFSQLLPAFAFTMIAVGFSSAAAMSSTRTTAVIGMLGAFAFLVMAAAWITIALPIGVSAMLRQGVASEAAPTLWMGIPIFTLVGIALIRVTSGIAHTILHVQVPAIVWFVVFGLLVTAQLAMGLAGWAVMRGQGYFQTYVRGDGASVASYGLICPGVALSVLSMFFIHWGLVQTQIVARLSPAHLALLALVGVVQFVTIRTLRRLDAKLMGSPAPAAVSAPARVAEAELV